MIRKTLLSKSEVLKEWKFSKNFPKVTGFRGVQEQAIDSLLEGEKVLCLMPTGGGKTLIFQVAGLALEKTTVVISPLKHIRDCRNFVKHMIPLVVPHSPIGPRFSLISSRVT